MLDKNNNLYKNKYRVDSTRLKNWDYSWNGYYFITICTKEKQHFFGTVENGEMILNEIGKIAEKFWLEIPAHFSNVKLDEFIIMPNHVHGILIIDNPTEIINQNEDTNIDTVETLQFNNHVETLQCNVSTKFYSQISPEAESLSTIIRSYKSICTKTINSSLGKSQKS